MEGILLEIDGNLRKDRDVRNCLIQKEDFQGGGKLGIGEFQKNEGKEKTKKGGNFRNKEKQEGMWRGRRNRKYFLKKYNKQYTVSRKVKS